MNADSGTRAAADAVVGVYLTFPDQDTALGVSRELVKRKLAACVNVLGAGTSVYEWDGRLTESSEVFALAKTTRRLANSLVLAVKELHPFEVPAAVVYEAVGGLRAYLEWVAKEAETTTTGDGK